MQTKKGIKNYLQIKKKRGVCMLRIHSFLQDIYRYVRSLSKQAYRTCAVILSGTVIVSIIALSSLGFGGGGKNRAFAFHMQEMESSYEDETEEAEADTEAKIQSIASDNIYEIQAMNIPGEYETDTIISIKEKNQLVQVSAQHSANEPAGTEAADSSESLAGNNLPTGLSEGTAVLSGNPVETEVLSGASEKASEQADVTMDEDITVASEKKTEEVVSNSADDSKGKEAESKEYENIPGLAVPLQARHNDFSAQYTPTEEEYNLLLHIVAAEAGGCDIIGQILVANVVLNRVQNEKFPDDIVSVVFERNQFSPALYGTVYESHISDSVIEAVNRALDGEDYSGGAHFFSARAYLDADSMAWFDNNLKWLFEHDGHEFYTFFSK